MQSNGLFLVLVCGLCCILLLGEAKVEEPSQRKVDANDPNNEEAIPDGMSNVKGKSHIENKFPIRKHATVPVFVNERPPAISPATVMEQIMLAQMLNNRKAKNSQIKPAGGSIEGAGLSSKFVKSQATKSKSSKPVKNFKDASPEQVLEFGINPKGGQSSADHQISSNGRLKTSASKSNPSATTCNTQSETATSTTADDLAAGNHPNFDNQIQAKLDDAWRGDTKIIKAPKTTTTMKTMSLRANNVSRIGDQQPSTRTLVPINLREDFNQANGNIFKHGMLFQVMQNLIESALLGELANKGAPTNLKLKQTDRVENNVAQPKSSNQQESSKNLSPEAVVKIQLAEPTGRTNDGTGNFKKVVEDNVNGMENRVSDQLGIEMPTMMIENGDSGWMETFGKQLVGEIQKHLPQTQQSRTNRVTPKPEKTFVLVKSKPLQQVVANHDGDGTKNSPAQIGAGSQVPTGTTSSNNSGRSTLIEKNSQLLKTTVSLLNGLGSDESILNQGGLTKLLDKIDTLIGKFLSKLMIKQIN